MVCCWRPPRTGRGVFVRGYAKGRLMELSYFLHEASLAFIAPARAASEAARLFFKSPANYLDTCSFIFVIAF